MKKYYVEYTITAKYVAEVTAESLEEAKEKGDFLFSEADFGEASDIDGEIVTVTDESGNPIASE